MLAWNTDSGLFGRKHKYVRHLPVLFTTFLALTFSLKVKRHLPWQEIKIVVCKRADMVLGSEKGI